MDDAAGTLGPYRLLRPIGRGGMARVYEAEHLHTGARHAVKELSCDGLDLEALVRFRREAELAGSLEHPHIARVHSAELTPPRPWIALELLGESLEQRLAEGPLSEEEARRILDEVAAGVAHAHARGVVHRDLKPANVLFASDGAAKVTDFGIAAAAHVERLTRTGELLGTPSYMAPEQIDDPREVGAPADVYALGAILYAALTGRPPVVAGGGLLATLLAVQRQPPPRPSALRPGLDPALEAVCLRALAKDPAERYPDAAAFRAALHGPPPPTRKGPLVVAGLAALATAALLLAAAFGPGRAPSPPPPVSEPDPPAPPPRARPVRPDPAPRPSPVRRGLHRLASTRWVSCPRVSMIAGFLPDGRLAVYDGLLLRIGAAPAAPLVWRPGIPVERDANLPHFLLALDDGELILGDPVLPLRWTRHPHVEPVFLINALARYGPDVLSGSTRGNVRLHDLTTGLVRAEGHVSDDRIRALAVGPRRRIYAVAGTTRGSIAGHGVLACFVERGGGLMRLQRRELKYAPDRLAVSPRGDLLAVGHASGKLTLYDPETLAPAGMLVNQSVRVAGLVGFAHPDAIRGLAFLGPDRLLSVGREGVGARKYTGTLRVWEVAARRERVAERCDVRPNWTSVHAERDGSFRIAVSGPGGVELWSYRD